MSNLSLTPVKGFRDVYPDQMAFRNWLFGKMRETARLFGYQEYEGPILEELQLYGAKSSEELVNEQTFRLTDRGGRELAMRPELTPSLARMVAAKKQQLVYPVRWFSIGPRFRYEAPQRGRGREFYQFDCDLLGVSTAIADSEILGIAATFFQKINLTPSEIVIKINSRSLTQHKLSLIEIPEDKTREVIHLIDKKDKISEKVWEELLQKVGLTQDQIKNLSKILTDRDASFESTLLTEIFSTLSDLGVADYFEYDPSIVRGLEYYTGIVFEARDRKGNLRALLGGGRYDNLVELFGGESVSGVGFATSDLVIAEVLKEFGKFPDSSILAPTPTKVLVTVFSEATARESIKLIRTFRDKGIAAEIYPDYKVKLDKQLKYADKLHIPYVVLLGPEEVSEGVVTLKNLLSGEQKKLSIDETIQLIRP